VQPYSLYRVVPVTLDAGERLSNKKEEKKPKEKPQSKSEVKSRGEVRTGLKYT